MNIGKGLEKINYKVKRIRMDPILCWLVEPFSIPPLFFTKRIQDLKQITFPLYHYV